MHQSLVINKTESQEGRTEATDIIPVPVTPSSELAQAWVYRTVCQHTQLQGVEEDKGRRNEIDGRKSTFDSYLFIDSIYSFIILYIPSFLR